GSEVHDLRFAHTAAALALPRSFHSLFQRLGHHDHARPAAIGAIIDGSIRIGAEITRVPHDQFVQTAFERAARHTRTGKRVEHLRKKGNSVKVDQKSAPQSTVNRPSATFTDTTTVSAKGISRS